MIHTKELLPERAGKINLALSPIGTHPEDNRWHHTQRVQKQDNAGQDVLVAKDEENEDKAHLHHGRKVDGVAMPTGCDSADQPASTKITMTAGTKAAPSHLILAIKCTIHSLQSAFHTRNQCCLRRLSFKKCGCHDDKHG